MRLIIVRTIKTVISMKTKKLFIWVSIAAMVMATMSSCMRVKIGDKDWSLINLSGHKNDTPSQVTEAGKDIAMQAFDELNLYGPFNVILEQGEGHKVRVDGTVDQLAAMTIYVKNGTLYIDMKEDMFDSDKFFKGMKVYVTATTIKGIELAGSGMITAPAALAVADMTMNVAGSGDITLAQLTCQDLSIEIAGSGDVTTGPIQAKKVRSQIAGSGDIDIAALTCTTLHNEIAGSGDMTFNNLNVETVNSQIAGSGDIILRGKAGTHKEDIAGSGTVDTSRLQ